MQRRRAAGADAAVKARIPSGVAGTSAGLFDVENQGVLIAIGAHFHDFLDLPGCGTLVPDFPARARPVNRLAFFQSHAQRLLVHPRQHERFAGVGIHRQRGNQAILIEFR